MTSLYTNIPHIEGIRAVIRFLEKHRPHGVTPFNPSITDLLELVLTLNNFEFNGNHYIQVGGTAMGTKVAPSLANIFMGEFEETHIYGQDEKIVLWLRFLDDIMGIYKGTPEELKDFVKNLNEAHPTIKFTLEFSEEKVNFLDTTVHLDGGKIWTDLYTKPTDSHSYLHYNSAHPAHSKKSLPYSQLLRVRRICSREEDFLKHSGMILYHFKERGYPVDLLQEALTRVLRIDRNTLLKVSNELSQKEDIVALVTTFNPEFSDLGKIIHNNWDLLERSSTTKKLAETKIIISYKRPKNLRDILVRARLPKLNEEVEDGNHTENVCKNKQGTCRYCNNLNTTGRIKSTFSGREYASKHNVCCKSSNLIYCIQCRICQKQYVGQTKNSLMQRFQGHWTDIKSENPKSDVGRHFNLKNHTGGENMEIFIVDFIHAHPDTQFAVSLHNEIEFHWIQRLRTMTPHGINTMDRMPDPKDNCRNWKNYHKNR